MHPKWQFSLKKKFEYGSRKTFPNRQSSAEKIVFFRSFLDVFLTTLGLEGCTFNEKMYNTGGHADIDYYALVAMNKSGGCECVFYRMWGTKYEEITPFISLYGTWVDSEAVFKEAIRERYGHTKRT